MQPEKIFNWLAFLVLWVGCSNQQSADLPEHLDDLQNLTIYSAAVDPAYQLNMEREQVFGGSQDVLIGNISQLEADSSGRIYIGDSQQKSIHVFQPDGNYLTSIGGEGHGPGEFQWIGNMQILSNKLFVYDPNSFNLNIFRISENLNTAPQF